MFGWLHMFIEYIAICYIDKENGIAHNRAKWNCLNAVTAKDCCCDFFIVV